MTDTEAPALVRDQLAIVFKVLRRMLRHWVGGLVATAVGVALTFAIVQLKPKHYVSESVLHYDPGVQWDVGGESPRQVGQRLKDIVLARPRLQEIIHQFGLYPQLVAAGRMDEAIEEMRRVTAFRVNEGGTFIVSYTAASPEEARRVTARLAEILMSQGAQVRSDQVEETKGFLDAERTQAEESLRAREAELASFLGRHPEFIQEVRRSVELAAPQEPEPLPPAAQPAPVPATPPHDPVADLRAAERQAQAGVDVARRDLALQRTRFTEKHPAVVAAADLLSQAEAAHQRALDALRTAEAAHPPVAAAPAPRPTQGARASPRRAASIAEAEAEYAGLARRVAEERERLQKLDARHFVAEIAASSFTTGHGAHVELIDPAYAPSQPSGTRPLLLLIFGCAGSLALGLVVSLGLALVDDRVYDRHDVERLGLAPMVVEVLHLGTRRGGAAAAADAPDAVTIVDQWRPTRRALPAPATGRIGGMPLLPVKGTGALEVGATTEAGVPIFAEAFAGPAGGSEASAPDFTMPYSAVRGMDGSVESPAKAVDPAPRPARAAPTATSATAASFRVLRHRLSERRGLRTVLVTSPEAGEGKTTCAVNLALATCEAGRARVLLVDANLQRPSLARLLGLPQRELPRGGHDAQRWSTVVPVTPWLHVATPAPGSPTSFVDAASVRAGLEELGAGEYDSVVVDGPPVLGSADVNLFEECVDGILLTMWAERSHASTLRDAVDQIGSPKVLGVVLMR